MASLCHYGIPGMKWGERRYQNLDGTLTEAGKRRQKLGRTNSSRLKGRSDTLTNLANSLFPKKSVEELRGQSFMDTKVYETGAWLNANLNNPSSPIETADSSLNDKTHDLEKKKTARF